MVDLHFNNDSTLTRFAEYLSSSNEEERRDLISSFEEDGFVSRRLYEQENKIRFGMDNSYPIRSWSYILNEAKYFKVGDVLYKDEDQIRLYQIDKNGNQTLLEYRINSRKLQSSSCNSGGKVNKMFGAYPAGASGMNTLEMFAEIEHNQPWSWGDEKLILYNDLGMREPDKDLASPATGTHLHYYTCDLYTKEGAIGLIVNQSASFFAK